MKATVPLKSRKEVLEYMRELIRKEQWGEVQKLRPRLAKYKSYSSDYLFKGKKTSEQVKAETDRKQQAINEFFDM